MNKRNIIILAVIAVVAIALTVGSRPFKASVDDQPGAPSPHAVDQ